MRRCQAPVSNGIPEAAPMLSSTAEYALRVIVHLATHASPPAKAQDIAAETKVPSGYAAKILQDLTRSGLVQSQRGPKGGFALARDASAITVLEVVSAVDPIRRIKVCPLGKKAHSQRLCRLHQRLDDAFAMVERTFAESTIAEMCGVGGTGGLCRVAPAPGKQIAQLTVSAKAAPGASSRRGRRSAGPGESRE